MPRLSCSSGFRNNNVINTNGRNTGNETIMSTEIDEYILDETIQLAV